jgi:hypothetical protein
MEHRSVGPDNQPSLKPVQRKAIDGRRCERPNQKAKPTRVKCLLGDLQGLRPIRVVTLQSLSAPPPYSRKPGPYGPTMSVCAKVMSRGVHNIAFSLSPDDFWPFDFGKIELVVGFQASWVVLGLGLKSSPKQQFLGPKAKAKIMSGHLTHMLSRAQTWQLERKKGCKKWYARSPSPSLSSTCGSGFFFFFFFEKKRKIRP